MNPKGKLSNTFIKSRYETQNGCCFYCEVKMVPRSYSKKDLGGFTQDHFIPLVMGGENDWSNKVLACYPCNDDKADRMPTEEEFARFRVLNFLNPPTDDVLAPWNRQVKD